MTDSLNLSDKTMWLLSIIDSTPYVDGNTRLQKYGLLTNKITLKDKSVYQDWESNNFGAFSQQLAIDAKILINNKCVKVHSIKNIHGEEHFRYFISEKGRDVLSSFKKSYMSLIEKMKVITKYYFDKSLNELLVDAYLLFPEYTDKSKIKPLVRKTFLEKNSNPGFSYRLPYTDKKLDLSAITSTARVNPFMYNDEEFRKKLAEESGLSKIPPLDIQAYDELEDIFADKKFLEDIDPEEIMEEIRA